MDGKSADRTESIDEKAVAIAENGTAEHCDGPSLDGQALAPGHREYLLQRHGTVDLIPLPCQDPADPLNWPNWKKHCMLALVAFHGLVSTGGSVAVVPAFETWAHLWGVTITTASYLGSSQMITLAIGPLIWLPFSNRFGRRPVWIMSTFGSALFNLGCALSPNYGTLMAMRILQAFFISPGIAMGQAVVAECFFAKERAQKMGAWALMITLGPPMGPFIMGFVVQHLTWHWIFWILTIVNFAQLIGYIFLGPESLYDRENPSTLTLQQRTRRQYIGFGRIIPKPITRHDILLPFYLLGDYRVLMAAVAYTITFNFTLVMIPVEIPSLFIPLFHQNAQQIGLNFLGLLVGSVLGEIVGGTMSDAWQNMLANRSSTGRARPEQRLWLSHIGSVLSIVGLTIFLVTLAEATPLHWTIKPIVGVAFAGFGVQIITTICITYCSDCHREIKSAALGVGINFVRCSWGFLGPFWFPYMFESSLGLKGSLGLMSGIIVLVTIVPICLLQYLGRSSSTKAT